MRYLFTRRACTAASSHAVAGERSRTVPDPRLDALLLQAWHRDRPPGARPGLENAPDGAALRALLTHPRYAHLRVLLVPSRELARFILDWLNAGNRAPSPQGQSSQFCEFFQAIQHLLAVSDRDLSLLLHIGPATVAHWASGAGAPHPLARDGILFKLATVAQRRFP